ncbi:DNA repair protein RecN [Andreesenia angusta]|uniref:DNA repair protein RecN n=1 Tax=Andreesenia angusta TaxID=39480 RepID=A0A1S1V8N5_9FIRM|nr:DNA repair protein RecN [Andreesenia angusta]OHW62981.1 DNA repair protein RecN [Andreesenia angusta]
MITDLNIENFAIIDRISISFESGLNIITGETGTGKSIVVDAINLLLGERSDKSFIRHGHEKARIEAVFEDSYDVKLKGLLESYGIECEEDGLLLVSREIYSNGRSVARINGRAATLTMLRELVPRLLDIQSQNENQKLLHSENQLEIIDVICGAEIAELKALIKEDYMSLKAVDRKIEKLSGDEMEKERKIDLLKFQIEEIECADLKAEEEEKLTSEYKKLQANEEIEKSLERAKSELSDGIDGASIMERVYQLHTGFSRVESYDEKLKSFSEEMLAIYYQMQELGRDIKDYSLGLEYPENSLEDLGRRLDQINSLKRKYGNTVEEILEYRDEVAKELELLYDLDNEIERLKAKKVLLEENLLELSGKASALRKSHAVQFQENIERELKALNMEDSVFEVRFSERDGFSETGTDRVDFMISTNLGQPIKPISKVVSGGELSRIMLAFKNILAEKDDIATLVFDEIDAGISGRTAQLVGEKIKSVSTLHQIICITHLPQIAAMADVHFRITKGSSHELTTAEVKKLDHEEKVDEITRLIGGVSLTDTSRKHAAEMLELSSKLK